MQTRNATTKRVANTTAHVQGGGAKMRFRMLLSVVALLLIATPALAINDYVVAINATTCVASENTDASKYTRYFGEIRFKAGVTGFLTFYCPIPTLTSSYNLLELIYTDDTGREWGSWVAANLRYVGDTAAAWGSSIAYVNSNTSPTTTPTTRSRLFGHAFDHMNRTYYVRVWMYRNSTDHDPRFRGVRLAYTVL